MPAPTFAARASEANASTAQKVDVAVVGAGFAGLYLLHRLRKAGFATMVFDEAGDVGGTWYWNRYPGARCDVQTIDYSYTFDPELEKAWTWSERYATQPEILRYLGFVADRYDLRRDIRFHTRVTAATWDQAAERWLLTTDDGAIVSCRYTSWLPAVSPRPSRRRSMASATSRARSTSLVAGRMRRSSSPANASRSSAREIFGPLMEAHREGGQIVSTASIAVTHQR
jgi:phytoene dehydrogenase-like protein